jgi:rRNA maturation protein Nop10
MSIRTIIALSAAIVLSTAATASAATKKQKVPRSGPQAHAIAPRAGPPFDPYSPINPYRPELQAVVPLATIKCSSATDCTDHGLGAAGECSVAGLSDACF